MISIEEAKDLKGKRVLVRVDFNVPIAGGAITDDFRIKKTLPLIEFLRNAGAKVILVAHLENEENDSLLPIFQYLEKLFPICFIPDFLSEAGKSALSLHEAGEVVLLENIRRYEGEKKNDPEFAEQLADIADVYVNEAFSVSHRSHASIVGVPKFLPHYAGFLLKNEVDNLSKAFKPVHPFIFILAGAKFETKLPLVEKFLKLADSVFIGGALANDLLKAQGFPVGASLVSDSSIDLSAIAKNPKLILPSDLVLEGKKLVSKDGAGDADRILDAGPATIAELKKVIAGAKFVLWNGTLGYCEGGYTEGTESLAKVIVESKAEAVVGGGDTLAAIADLKIFDKFSFVSTGGGAMLDFLAHETLPGIDALNS